MIFSQGESAYTLVSDSTLTTLVAIDWIREGTPFVELVAWVKDILISVDARVSARAKVVDEDAPFSDEAMFVRSHSYLSRHHLRGLEQLERVTLERPADELYVRLATLYTSILKRQTALDLSGW